MAPRHTESQHLLHHRPLRESASSPWQHRAEPGGAGDRPRLSAINNNSKPVCLSLTRKYKSETIGCGSWSPDTLCRAVGRGEGAEIPNNSNYTNHGTVWGWELLPSAVASPGTHPACCPRFLLSMKICWERARMGSSAGGQNAGRRPDSPTAQLGLHCELCAQRDSLSAQHKGCGREEGLSPMAKVGCLCAGAPNPGSKPPWGTGRSKQSSLLQGRWPQQLLAVSCKLPGKGMLRAAGSSAPPRRKTMSQQL